MNVRGIQRGSVGTSSTARAGFMKYAFVSACMNLGLAVGMQTDLRSVRKLIAQMHPLATEHPLIRMGGHGDGGYLVPDDLEGIAACFSPGVGRCASFEESLIERGIPCFLADGSVDGPPFKSDLVDFTNKFLDVTNTDTTITIDRWVRLSSPGSDDLILQMDIEGAEWPVLLNASRDTLRRFRIIVVEMHNIDRLMDKHAFVIIRSTFELLLQDFYIIHNHPNNYGWKVRYRSLVIPRVMEMTLIRKDRVMSPEFVRTFPHPLDETNKSDWPDIVLPREWYHSSPSRCEKAIDRGF
jgi:hypothetical protein